MWILSAETGKGSRRKPISWCTICGWIHFRCSGLKRLTDYDAASFVCPKCNRNHVISSALSNKEEMWELHNLYTITKQTTAFGGLHHISKKSGLPRETVEKYLSTSPTYTKIQNAACSKRAFAYMISKNLEDSLALSMRRKTSDYTPLHERAEYRRLHW